MRLLGHQTEAPGLVFTPVPAGRAAADQLLHRPALESHEDHRRELLLPTRKHAVHGTWDVLLSPSLILSFTSLIPEETESRFLQHSLLCPVQHRYHNTITALSEARPDEPGTNGTRKISGRTASARRLGNRFRLPGFGGPSVCTWDPEPRPAATTQAAPSQPPPSTPCPFHPAQSHPKGHGLRRTAACACNTN